MHSFLTTARCSEYDVTSEFSAFAWRSEQISGLHKRWTWRGTHVQTHPKCKWRNEPEVVWSRQAQGEVEQYILGVLWRLYSLKQVTNPWKESSLTCVLRYKRNVDAYYCEGKTYWILHIHWNDLLPSTTSASILRIENLFPFVSQLRALTSSGLVCPQGEKKVYVLLGFWNYFSIIPASVLLSHCINCQLLGGVGK